MKRLVLVMLIYAALVIANAWVLALPVEAADCSAKCGNGGTVQCSGYSCSARDGVGCTAWDSHGRQLIQMPCNNE
jgi:hypothetical protein